VTDRSIVVLLFTGAALISGITILQGIQLNDEGLMLQAAARIADGQVPYRDFWWFYPPGQPYLLAFFWKLFGPSLLTWRILRVLCDAAVATLAWALARRGGASQGVAIGVWLAAALAMAYPSGPHPFPPTLALCLGALLLMEKRPVLAGGLAGLAALWRIEFAAYLGVGVLLAYAMKPARRREQAEAAALFAGTAMAVTAVLYAPVVIKAGLSDSFDLLIRYPVQDFARYQSLPFPVSYDGALNTSSIGGFFSDSAESLLLFYLPLVLMIGLAGAVAALALRYSRERWWQVAAGVFAIGMAHYLVTRPDAFHTAPLAVMVAVLASWAIAQVVGNRVGKRDDSLPPPRRGRLQSVVVPAAAIAAVVAVGYGVVEGLDRRWLELRADRAELRLTVADGVRVAKSQRGPLERAVHWVQSHTKPGEPIYVAPKRADLVTAGAPLLYVLADRPNPTRYDIAAPGVVTSQSVQEEIVGDLDRFGVRAVIRWVAPESAAHEPNRAGESSRVTFLDDYLRRRYRQAARYGDYVLLERR
jgi:hypothetical protein